jgi:signal transduction histidine kinase
MWQDIRPHMPSLTLRLRMILLFCVVMGVFLAGTYVVIYRSFRKEVRNGFDGRLLDVAQPLIAQIQANPMGNHVASLPLQNHVLAVLDGSGRVIESSQTTEQVDTTSLRPLPEAHAEFRMLHLSRGRELRAAIVPFTVGKESRWFVIAEPTARIDQIEAAFRERAFGLWTLSLLLTTLIAAWYVGRSLSPIVTLSRHAAKLTEEAVDVTHGDFQASLPITYPFDEVGTLAANFNVLFAKIGAVVRQLRQFVSDAAHELRTPLAVVRGETEYLLAQDRSADEYRAILRTIDDELTVMVGIIEGLFTLSMADAGQLRLANERVHLNEVLEEACGIAAPGARRKNIRIERFSEWAEIEFSGDPALLRQLFVILLENATKYSPAGTIIRVGLTMGNGCAQAIVEDEGYGIAPEHLPHIFERFYRAAPTEDSRSGGLGLAIAQAIVNAYRGAIWCDSKLGVGSRFTVQLPWTATEDLKPHPGDLSRHTATH